MPISTSNIRNLLTFVHELESMDTVTQQKAIKGLMELTRSTHIMFVIKEIAKKNPISINQNQLSIAKALIEKLSSKEEEIDFTDLDKALDLAISLPYLNLDLGGFKEEDRLACANQAAHWELIKCLSLMPKAPQAQTLEKVLHLAAAVGKTDLVNSLLNLPNKPTQKAMLKAFESAVDQRQWPAVKSLLPKITLSEDEFTQKIITFILPNLSPKDDLLVESLILPRNLNSQQIGRILLKAIQLHTKIPESLIINLSQTPKPNNPNSECANVVFYWAIQQGKLVSTLAAFVSRDIIESRLRTLLSARQHGKEVNEPLVRELAFLSSDNQPSQKAIDDTLEQASLFSESLVRDLCRMTGANKPSQAGIDKALQNLIASETSWDLLKELCLMSGINQPSQAVINQALERAVHLHNWDLAKNLCLMTSNNRPSYKTIRNVLGQLYLAKIQNPDVQAFLSSLEQHTDEVVRVRAMRLNKKEIAPTATPQQEPQPTPVSSPTPLVPEAPVISTLASSTPPASPKYNPTMFTSPKVAKKKSFADWNASLISVYFGSDPSKMEGSFGTYIKKRHETYLFRDTISQFAALLFGCFGYETEQQKRQTAISNLKQQVSAMKIEADLKQCLETIDQLKTQFSPRTKDKDEEAYGSTLQYQLEQLQDSIAIIAKDLDFTIADTHHEAASPKVS